MIVYMQVVSLERAKPSNSRLDALEGFACCKTKERGPWSPRLAKHFLTAALVFPACQCGSGQLLLVSKALWEISDEKLGTSNSRNVFEKYLLEKTIVKAFLPHALCQTKPTNARHPPGEKQRERKTQAFTPPRASLQLSCPDHHPFRA